MAPTSHIWCPTSSKILTESRQTCQEEPEDPSRSRFSLILDPSRPRFSMNLGTFCKYFKRCFAHCVRPPTCSFDASGQRFSLSWCRSRHISNMFCTCFVRCFACLAPFRLIFSRIGWTSTWCCDGRLAKPAQSGAAPLVCCSAVIRQEYQTSESNSGIFRSPPPCWTTPLPPADPSSSKSLQVPPSSSTPDPSWET